MFILKSYFIKVYFTKFVYTFFVPLFFIQDVLKASQATSFYISRRIRNSASLSMTRSKSAYEEQNSFSIMTPNKYYKFSFSSTHLNFSDLLFSKTNKSRLMIILPKFRYLTDLFFENCNLGNQEAKLLAISLVQLPRWRYIDLKRNTIGDRGALALANSFQYLKKKDEDLLSDGFKREIILNDNPISKDGINFLIKGVLLSHEKISVNFDSPSAFNQSVQVTTSSLCLNTDRWIKNIPFDSWNVTLKSLDFPKLKKIILIQKLNEFKDLKILNLLFSNIGNEETIELAKIIPNLLKLRSLNLRGNNIGDKGAISLSKYLKYSNLCNLTLDDNPISAIGIKGLLIASLNTTFLTISLDEEQAMTSQIIATNKHAVSLVLHQKIKSFCSSSRILNFYNLIIFEFKMTHFLESFSCFKKLVDLAMVKCGINNKTTATLANALEKNSTLISLDLGHNLIGDSGASALSDLLRKQVNLSTLLLHYNSIGNEGAIALVKALKKRLTQTSLSLQKNKIGNKGIIAFAENLPHIHISFLNLAENPTSRSSIHSLIQRALFFKKRITLDAWQVLSDSILGEAEEAYQHIEAASNLNYKNFISDLVVNGFTSRQFEKTEEGFEVVPSNFTYLNELAAHLQGRTTSSYFQALSKMTKNVIFIKSFIDAQDLDDVPLQYKNNLVAPFVLPLPKNDTFTDKNYVFFVVAPHKNNTKNLELIQKELDSYNKICSFLQYSPPRTREKEAKEKPINQTESLTKKQLPQQEQQEHE